MKDDSLQEVIVGFVVKKPENSVIVENPLTLVNKYIYMYNLFFSNQVDDLIHRTSHTLHLLIEYDPVRHRLDRLRLESPGNRLGVPATSRMRMSSPSDTVLERTDVVDDGTLKRRSLRYVTTTKKHATSIFWTL